MSKSKVGRPRIIDDLVIRKLEGAFLTGCTDAEACLVAGVSTSTFYDYCKENPSFSERKEVLKRQPIIDSKKCIAQEVKTNPKAAMEYLKASNRCREEFGPVHRFEIEKPNYDSLLERAKIVEHEERQRALPGPEVDEV